MAAVDATGTPLPDATVESIRPDGHEDVYDVQIPGINEFEGYTFHTSRWDYGYTGGDSSGGLDKLADKVVGIIGTGATAVQQRYCTWHATFALSEAISGRADGLWAIGQQL